ncbi:uncharacterized protein CANTADRAFT_4427 [Suhomyces tanzawaensis NRRL Y-17324]|uniref:PI31 proteasome regulator C-terminal domain-containing protein n=1 Tax=Suhomyces tanzawaensis NRRL Y-17324 TaxID=984487 RepID=A0A1E4SSF0_9ASCO|nr:uncharacterized protein CANTADRAFT_4427 [Suhomyces tanzawaensis NRRL Y-17324]ODV82434.1 hypothetical protein CANTADRAFT_4427 [Suhomyces tanzawaensis NRRL Y-17324]
MINNHLQLTAHLAANYVGSLYPTCNQFRKKSVTETDQLVQFQLVEGDLQLLTITVTELSQQLNVVSFVHGTPKKVDNVTIDWSLNDLIDHEIQFPINEINLSNDLIQAFNKRVRDKTGSDTELRKLFDRPVEVPQEKPHRKSPNPRFNDADRLDNSTAPTGTHHTRPADMPDFEDELEIRAPPRGTGSALFPAIGDRDLNPPGLPKHPEMKPFIDPLGSEDGGMFPSPHHPLFGGRPQGGNTSRLGVPPGARFDDPYGEDDLDALGAGLPGNVRSSSAFGYGPGPGGPGFGGPGGPGFGSSDHGF